MASPKLGRTVRVSSPASRFVRFARRRAKKYANLVLKQRARGGRVRVTDDGGDFDLTMITVPQEWTRRRAGESKISIIF